MSNRVKIEDFILSSYGNNIFRLYHCCKYWDGCDVSEIGAMRRTLIHPDNWYCRCYLDEGIVYHTTDLPEPIRTLVEWKVITVI